MNPRSLLAGLLVVLAASCGAVDEPQTVRPLVGTQLVAALRDGGYVLYLRHTETPEDGTDEPDSLGDCSRQRALNAAGRADARALGAAVRALGVPVGEVLASPYCRTVERAEGETVALRADGEGFVLVGGPPQGWQELATG